MSRIKKTFTFLHLCYEDTFSQNGTSIWRRSNIVGKNLYTVVHKKRATFIFGIVS